MNKIIQICKKIDENFKLLGLKKIYKTFLNFRRYLILYKLKKKNKFYICFYLKNSNILSQLSEKHGSDKGGDYNQTNKPFNWEPHTYTSYYYEIFNHQREDVKLVFECGIGSPNEKFLCNMTKNGKPGASLRVWRDYFINAKIFGADIDKSIMFSEERIKTYYVNQLDRDSIISMWENIKERNFDLIIDDGLHEVQANLNLFFHSFNKLRSGGIYVIEDVEILNLNKLQKALSGYSSEAIILGGSSNTFQNNNLLVIRKN